MITVLKLDFNTEGSPLPTLHRPNPRLTNAKLFLASLSNGKDRAKGMEDQRSYRRYMNGGPRIVPKDYAKPSTKSCWTHCGLTCRRKRDPASYAVITRPFAEDTKPTRHGLQTPLAEECILVNSSSAQTTPCR
ncbi:hypothetical protein L3X38_032919 [Prunus dulcis]|uniref:Uncharacterized protein n=1 Tax=Prunus dulcis TaxID=3755 RepID=A0AAD4VG30_PRUDU|nr:hypothetical protein L3X38_032919 [Prunus dulcis]